jgi:thiol-disulfide isomerase/thioredoxin
MAELLTSIRPVALRLFPIACMLLTPALLLAQSTGNYCEPLPAVKEELKKVSKVSDEDLPYKARLARQTSMLRELLKKYPDDFHVQRRYQDSRRTGFAFDREALVADYRTQMEKKPNDPVAIYLYTRLLFGNKTKEAIELSQKLTQQAPDFPWSHLQLAEIYSYPSFRDLAESKEHLKQWTTKCPGSRAALTLVSRLADKETMTEAAQSLRGRLASSTSSEDLNYWDALWRLEFKLKPVAEHAPLRQQIAEDLKRLRAMNLNSKEWLQALQSGYKQVGDKAGERWAEDELMRLLPKSETARRIVQARYYDGNPYPKPEEPEAKKQAYNQALVQVTAEWLKQWPNDEMTWSARLRSLSQLERSSNAELEAAYDGYAKAHEQEGNSYSIPPIEVTVARLYLKRGFRLERVPALLQKGLSEIEGIDKSSSGRSDLYPREDDSEGGNLRYVRWQTWPLFAEAYARLKQPDKAAGVLARMADDLKQKKPGEQAKDSQRRGHAYNQAIYWEAVAKVAEAEQRKLDALTAYQTALTLRPKPLGPTSSNKDELSDSTQRLWKELGGTDQGWSAYLARIDISKSKFETAEVVTWDTKNTVLPEFELTDLDGRKWSLADLKGKVAFINVWATWCGPCRWELPYLEKLREQMKEKKDVVILTLNIDEQVGMVQPFMKENKYTFPVLLGQAYAESQGVNSIPRNWVVNSDGKIVFEGIGFGNDGEEWMKKAAQIIEKVKGTN